MIFLDKDIALALYPPELIPLANRLTLEAGKETRICYLTETALKLKGHPVLVCSFAQDRHTDVSIRLYADREIREEIATAFFKDFPETEEVKYPAKKELSLVYFNAGTATITGYKSIVGLWILKPTILEKLLYTIPLKPEEERDVAAVKPEFEKGLLPLPLSSNPLVCLKTKFEREYQVIRSETKTYTKTIGAGKKDIEVVSPIHARPNEFLVLKGVAANTSSALLNIKREAVDATPLSIDCAVLSLDFDLPLWLHAAKLFTISADNPTALDITVNLKIKLDVCRLSTLAEALLLEEGPEVEKTKIGVW